MAILFRCSSGLIKSPAHLCNHKDQNLAFFFVVVHFRFSWDLGEAQFCVHAFLFYAPPESWYAPGLTLNTTFAVSFPFKLYFQISAAFGIGGWTWGMRLMPHTGYLWDQISGHKDIRMATVESRVLDWINPLVWFSRALPKPIFGPWSQKKSTVPLSMYKVIGHPFVITASIQRLDPSFSFAVLRFSYLEIVIMIPVCCERTYQTDYRGFETFI